jgi:hypothetical protein
MTPTHVLILAQGSQKRMGGDRSLPKQMLPLSAHILAGAENIRILDRTIGQVMRILTGDATTPESARAGVAPHGVTVIGNAELRRMEPRGVFWMQDELGGPETYGASPEVHTLPDPGNSSLMGLARALDRLTREPQAPRGRRIILLGDVVYSWACLEKLFRPEDAGAVTFCGTPDLDAERGELWGVSWFRSAENLISDALDFALTTASKHEDEYQPGQLRQLLFAVDHRLLPDAIPEHLTKGFWHKERHWFCEIDDYTMDVDLPEHLIDLARSSLQALADDQERGLERRG